jgi:RNA polymerase sigma-70 factor (ECF subfamily)
MKRKEFPKFYDTYADKIYKYVFFRVGGNKELAEDLTQDIFVKALDAFDRYDTSVSISAWIYTIARNHIINTIQKQKPQVSLEDTEAEASLRRDWGSVLETSFDENRLLEALDRLEEDEALLVRMKYLEGWKYDEISEILGKSSGALRVQASRTLRKLRGILKQK